MIGKDVARAWRNAVGDAPIERPLTLNESGDVVDVETGEIIGQLKLKHRAPRDAFFRVLNMEQRTGDEPV